MPERVLVTGADGFIGRNTVQALLRQDHLLRRCTRLPGEGSDIAVGDIGPDTDWSQATQGIETVIHLANRAHVFKQKKRKDAQELRKVNVDGTCALAHQAVSSGVKRFVYLSSIGVNGHWSSRPFTELDPPNPSGAYANSKLEAERRLYEIAHESEIELVIIRPPLVYGPQAPGNFRRLIHLVQKGIPLPFGAVQNKRSLIAVDNLVDLLIHCLDHPAAAGQTFLASDGQDVSTPELIRRIAAGLGRRARLVPIPPKVLHAAGQLVGFADAVDRLISSLQVDLSHTCKTLDWQPPISLDRALQQAVESL